MAAIDYQILRGVVGEQFSQTPSVTQPVRFWEAQGLPEGFSINATTGLITGTPEVEVKDLPGYRLPVSIRTIDALFVKKIAANQGYSVGLTSDGKVIHSGVDNVNNQQNGDLVASLSGVTEIAAGPVHTLALKANGTVVGWINTNADNIYWDKGQHIPPVGLSGVIKIAAGGFHSLALKSNGTVVGWGSGGSGAATPPAGLTGVVDIACGWEHSVALKSNGTVVTWGGDYPATPSNLTSVTAIAATAHYPASHTLALKSDGTVVAWGLPDITVELGAPTVPDPRLQVPAGLTGVVGIAAGPDYSLAWKADGTLVRFGVENPAATLPEVPTSIPGIINAAIGNGFYIALKNNGIVQGYGSSGLIPGSSYSNPKFLPKKDERTIFFAFGKGVPFIEPNQSFQGQVGSALNAPIVFANSIYRPISSVAATGLPSWASIIDKSIVGTPTAAGNTIITLTPTGPEGVGIATTATLAISMGPPIITPGQSFNGTAGQSFSATPALTSASYRPATAWTAQGLPAGLSINATTGLISGTPTASGTSDATLIATGSGGSSAATSVQFVIFAAILAPLITPGQSFNGTAGTAFSAMPVLTSPSTRPATGWTAEGLPAGLSINATTGVISGTPSMAETSTATLTATGPGGSSDPAGVQFVIAANNGGGGGASSTILLAQNQNFTAQIGVDFTATPALISGTATKWYVTGLPEWAAINSTTGAITGTPTFSGLSTLMITAVDAANATSSALVFLNTLAWNTLEIFVDPKNRVILSKSDTKSPLQKIQFKRDDRLPFRVVFVDGTTPFSIPESFSVSVGLKKSYQDDQYLAYSSSVSGTLDLASEEIDALFAANPATIPALMEVRWEDLASAFRTATLPVVLQNSVIHGNEYNVSAYMAADAASTAAATSQAVRALSAPIFGISKNNSYPVGISPEDRRVSIAYPASLGEIGSIRYAEFNNADVTDTFSKSTVPVSVPGAEPVPYFVYTYIADVPFDDYATYIATL